MLYYCPLSISRIGILFLYFAPYSLLLWIGLFPETHGILDDYMYDKTRSAFFDVRGKDRLDSLWWKDAEPLWVRALRNNRTVSVHRWEGCQVDFNGTRASPCDSFRGDSDAEFEATRRQLLRDIENFKMHTVDLAMFQYGHVGYCGERAPQIGRLGNFKPSFFLFFYRVIGKNRRKVPIPIILAIFENHQISSLWKGARCGLHFTAFRKNPQIVLLLQVTLSYRAPCCVNEPAAQ